MGARHIAVDGSAAWHYSLEIGLRGSSNLRAIPVFCNTPTPLVLESGHYSAIPSRMHRVFCLVSFITMLLAAGATRADETVFAEALHGAWENWSWDTAVDFSATSPVHDGSRSMAISHNAPWAGCYLHRNGNLSTSGISVLKFWAHGGTTGGTKQVTVGLINASGGVAGERGISFPLGTWTEFVLPLNTMGSPSSISGVVWQDLTGGGQPTFYIDTVILGEDDEEPPPPDDGPPLTVSASAGRRPISPYIYGMNFCSEALATELGLPLNRWGGNATTRYNWQLDVSNRAFDWYFENIPHDNANIGLLPHGSASDVFVDANNRAGATSMINMPMIGFTPRDREFRGAFPVSIYGPQTSVDPWRPEFGNGVRQSDGQNITGNDPALTSTVVGPEFNRAWIAHLTSRYGDAASGGVRFYTFDNEPELWSSTHRDVRPQALGYDELRSLTESYGAALKAEDPTALTLGPSSWGWTGYFYSNLDWAPGGAWWNNPLDRNAHGGIEHSAWYLARMRDYEQTHGVRVLDYFDLHYYPQATGVSLSQAGSTSTQELRLRSTRALWDPTYFDESWIADEVALIPRMKDWVNQNYPGTKLALTEYNWGAYEHINGALAQADVLGIFGREGMDLAALWVAPASDEPCAFAFRMYMNYDGQRAKFGDTSVRATSGDQSRMSVYAATRSGDGALTVMVVNKAMLSLETTVTVQNFKGNSNVAVYRYSPANLQAIVREADETITAGVIAATFPTDSITLFVVTPTNEAKSAIVVR